MFTKEVGVNVNVFSPLHYYEGFFSFLYLLSIFFLFYVFCCEQILFLIKIQMLMVISIFFLFYHFC